MEFGFETGYPENKSHSSEIEILLVIRYFLAMGGQRPYGGAKTLWESKGPMGELQKMYVYTLLQITSSSHRCLATSDERYSTL